MSNRVTPSKRSKKSKLELFSRRNGVGRDGLARVLADAVDSDPFEIIGIASIAASSMRENLGEFFDELAEEDPRLGPVLWATVAALPFLERYAKPEQIVDEVLPAWLVHLYDAKVTSIMRRPHNQRRNQSSYLVEVSMVAEAVTTCVIGIRHGHHDEIISFWTVAAPIDEVADFYEQKHRRTNGHIHEPVALAAGCQNLLIAFDGTLHEGRHTASYRAPWPLNLPVATLVIELAMNEIEPTDDEPYLAERIRNGGGSSAARKLRRSLQTWPTAASTI